MTATQTSSDRPKNLFGFLPVLSRWKYQILGLTAIALIVSTIVSLVLPNVYKSTTVFYPTRFSAPINDIVTEGGKMEFAASTEEIDRLITMGQSQPLAEYIIRKYKLNKDYDFENMDDEASKQYIFDTFYSNLSMVHTERDAIELTFYSEDKVKAAAVANDIVAKMDSMNQQLSLENRKKLIEIFKNQYTFLGKDLEIMRDSLAKARTKYGIFVSSEENRYLSKAVLEMQTNLAQAKGELEYLSKSAGAADGRVVALKAKINGLENANRALLTGASGGTYNMQSYMAGADIVRDLSEQFINLSNRYLQAKTIYESAKFAISGKISTIYIVQKAYPATRKAKPVRWLIVASSTLITFILSLVFVSLFELYKYEKFRYQL